MFYRMRNGARLFYLHNAAAELYSEEKILGALLSLFDLRESQVDVLIIGEGNPNHWALRRLCDEKQRATYPSACADLDSKVARKQTGLVKYDIKDLIMHMEQNKVGKVEL